MWTHQYQQKTELTAHELWPVIANIDGWAEIDENIESISVEGLPVEGTQFFLKPRGGPKLAFIVDTFQPPTVYSDVCTMLLGTMPLATMKTTHQFSSHGHGTIIDIQISIKGPLAPLWGVLVGRKHASGLPRQTQLFIQAAQELKGSL